MRDVLTIGEVVAVIQRLDGRRGRTVSARQLRYWSQVLAVGAGKATDGGNAAHVFTAADVAVVRLIRRLQVDEVKARAIWALLITHGNQLRRAFSRGTATVLWMESNGRAHLLSAAEAASKSPRECYRLADCAAGIEEAIKAERHARSHVVWDGAKAVPARELVAV